MAPLLLTLLGAAPRGQAYGPPPPPTPYDQCEAAVAAAHTRIIPEMLLPAIARVESGRLDPVFGRVRPWPWTINVEGVGSFYDSKADAVAAVEAFQAKGVRSIDVGCMQVNLLYHPAAFATLDDAFDPVINATYATRFLTGLYNQTRDWNLAAAYYHSQTQELGEEYQRRLFGRVMTPMGPSTAAPPPPTNPYGAFLPTTDSYGAFAPRSLSYGAFAPSSQSFGAFAPATSPFGAFSGSGGLGAAGGPLPFGLVIPPPAPPHATPRR